MERFAGVVLAGGKSKRMGRDKANLIIGNEIILNHSIHLLQQFVHEIFISVNESKYKTINHISYLPDSIKNIGPTGGIFTALKIINNPIIVLPCDMPFVTKNHLKLLISNYIPHVDAVIASSEKGREPLLGIYAPSFLIKLEYNLKKKEYSLQKILRSSRVKFVEFREAGYITDGFFNINNPEDYKIAKKINKKFLIFNK